MCYIILFLFFCILFFIVMVVESVDLLNVNFGVNSNEKGVEKIMIEGVVMVNNKLVGMFNLFIFNLEYDLWVDL